MLHAVEAPLLRFAALAGLAVAGTLGAAGSVTPSTDHSACGGDVRRLELHAPDEPDAIYLTAWRHGDVFVSVAGAPRTLTFQTRARIWDGCEWLATETLTPEGEGRFRYRYDEEIVRCAPDATPTRKTPRTGYVLALPVE